MLAIGVLSQLFIVKCLKKSLLIRKLNFGLEIAPGLKEDVEGMESSQKKKIGPLSYMSEA